MFTKTRMAIAALFVACITLVPNSATASVPRIEATPSSSSLAPGQTVAVNFVLDNPIVCATNPCDVTLDFSSVLTLGLTASSTSVNWTAAQWSQQRTITFRLDPNTPATYPQTINLSVPAQSNSEYYRGFTPALSISLLVPDIRPTPTPSPTQNELAVTGTPVTQNLLYAGYVTIAGIGLVVASTIRRSYLRRKGLHKTQ
jgi:hypothetical protein